jgi:hypothetical protein
MGWVRVAPAFINSFLYIVHTTHNIFFVIKVDKNLKLKFYVVVTKYDKLFLDHV